MIMGFLMILAGVSLVLCGLFWEEKRLSKVTAKKIFNLKALQEELRREDEKARHAAETTAKRARRAQAREESKKNAQTIRELVESLDRDARTAAMLAQVPTIQVREDPYTGDGSPCTFSCSGDGSPCTFSE